MLTPLNGYSNIDIPNDLVMDNRIVGSLTFPDLSNHIGLSIDIEGCKSLLDPEIKKGKRCVICNMHELRSRDIKGNTFPIPRNNRCKECPFIFNSAPKKGEGCRIGCGARFLKYGIINPRNVGKCQFFYFMYYKQLQFKLPDTPFRDYLGNYNDEKIPPGVFIDSDNTRQFMWIIHHWNGLWWDDRVWNLMLVLNTEHGYIHGLLNREYEPWKLIQENSF